MRPAPGCFSRPSRAQFIYPDRWFGHGHLLERFYFVAANELHGKDTLFDERFNQEQFPRSM